MARLLKYKQAGCSWRIHVSVAVEGRPESEIIEGRTLQTKYHTRRILQTETDGRCRLC